MMGRITQGMMNTQLLRNLNTNLNRMSLYQEQTSTNRKINRPSDDPVGLSYAMRYRSNITANEQYQENIDSTNSWLDFTDTMMGQANDVLQRVRELTVQAANGSNSESSMSALKDEIVQLTSQLVTIGNSQFNGKYVFNGQITDVAPYSSTIGYVQPSLSVEGPQDVSNANVTDSNNKLSLRINGNSELTVQLPPKDYSGGGAAMLAADLQTAINAASPAAQVTVTTGATNGLVITTNDTSATGSIEITGGTFANQWLSASRLMNDLIQTPNPLAAAKSYSVDAKYGLTDNQEIRFEITTGVTMPVNISGNKMFGSPSDSDNVFRLMDEVVSAISQMNNKEVSNLLGKMDSRINKFLEVRSELGAKVSRIQLTEDRLKDIDINLKTLQSKTEDADVAELITNLKTAENVYQASLSVGSKVIAPSLVDFMR